MLVGIVLLFILNALSVLGYYDLKNSRHADFLQTLSNTYTKKININQKKYTGEELKKQNLITTIIYSKLASNYKFHLANKKKEQLISHWQLKLEKKPLMSLFNHAQKQFLALELSIKELKDPGYSHHLAYKNNKKRQKNYFAKDILSNQIKKTKLYLSKNKTIK